MKNGSIHIMVRFQYDNKKYVKNFTKIYGVETIPDAEIKLNEIKVKLSRGIDVFSYSTDDINGLWERFTKLKVKEGKWKKTTLTTYTNQYDRWIRKSIGYKKIEKIKYYHIKNIIDKMAHLSVSSKSFVKLMLQDLFDESVRSGLIHENVVKKIKLDKHIRGKRQLRNISLDNPLDIVKKIYNTIPKYETQMKKFQTPEVRTSFYLLLMTAHRANEILSLNNSHVYLENKKFISTPDITKTKEYYHFPIPEEIIPFLKESLRKRKKLFPNMIRETLLKRWKELIDMSEIPLMDGKSLTIHDTRRLMLSVMINDCNIDSRLADACLEHKPTGIIQHYLGFTYKDIENAYQKFWKVIRGENVKDIEKETSDIEITLDDIPKELLEMIKLQKKSIKK